MRGSNRILDVALLSMLGFGCSSSDPNVRTIQGQLDRSAFALTQEEAVAVSSSGQIWKSAIGSDGKFALTLPVDSTYEMRFARASGGTLQEFAYLTQPTVGGLRKQTFMVTAGSQIDLGLVAPRTSIQSSTLRSHNDDQGEDEDQDEDKDEDQNKDEDHDEDKHESSPTSMPVCEPAAGSMIVEVQSSHNLLRDCDSDHDGSNDADDPDTEKECRPVHRDNEGHRCGGHSNNGHGNNADGVDVSNPGKGRGGPNGEVDQSGSVDDENHGAPSSHGENCDEDQNDDDQGGNDACAPPDELPPNTCTPSGGDQPSPDQPNPDQPSGGDPTSNPPSDNPPANDPPANDPPANDPPANDPPANDPPADGTVPEGGACTANSQCVTGSLCSSGVCVGL